jgi:hypothetical protein
VQILDLCRTSLNSCSRRELDDLSATDAYGQSLGR